MSAAEFAPSKQWPDNPEVKLTGNWETEGEGYWYANWKAVTALAQAGLVKQEPGDGTKFTAVAGVRFCIWRVLEGESAHRWSVVTYDRDGATAVTFGAFPDPVKPQVAPAAGPPPPQGAQAGPPSPQLSGAPSAPGTPPVAPAEPPPQQSDEERKSATAKHHRQMLSEVDGLYGLCLAIAAYRQVQIFEIPMHELDQAGLRAGAATIMIRLEHLGYDGKTDRRPAYVKRLQRLLHDQWPDDYPPVPSDVKGNGKGEKPAAAKAPTDPGPEPRPVATVPGTSLEDFPEALDEGEDDLPF
ncbi:MAG: hypothetical protein ACYS5V_00520 [Planctomycetota bacterium]